MDLSLSGGVEQLIREVQVPIDGIETADLTGFLERVGDARVVLLGSATHGTSEFYRWRARLTRDLVMHRGFTIIAAEADWADVARIDRHVRHLPKDPRIWRAFDAFPQWRFRNYETVDLMEWLRAHNAEVRGAARAGVYGLDFYGLFGAAAEVVRALQRLDPPSAEVARARYALLTQGQLAPGAYSHVPSSGEYATAEAEVVHHLEELLARRVELGRTERDKAFDAVANARVLAGAAQHYRALYYGSAESWRAREQHLFETLLSLLAAGGASSRAVVWAHNAQVGDAAATALGDKVEPNLGHLCRRHFGAKAYSVGFGSDHGYLWAARGWNEEGERMRLKPALPGSYEQLFHDAGAPAFMLPLRAPARLALREELSLRRLQRSVGPIYRPATEATSHYVEASLPTQFDEYVWFDETRALCPLTNQPSIDDVPDTWPFGI